MKRYNNVLEFAAAFNTEQQCLEHLCKIKWGVGYQCRKCQHNIPVKGRTWYYRKCQKCHYDESCTSQTLFHKLKFSVVKAFWITYHLSTLKKGLSTMEIARQYQIHQSTAWFFKRKVQQAMASGSQPLLQGFVEVDETVIGGMEKDQPGRSHGKKQMVEVAIELTVTDGKPHKLQVKNAAARVIKDYSANELGAGIEKMVDKEADICTDQWSAYPKAVAERTHLTFPSSEGKNFEQLHWHIFNLKNWIRGTHHKVSAGYMQPYLDEFHYRFNRRNQIQSCPTRLLNRMTKAMKMPRQMLVYEVA